MKLRRYIHPEALAEYGDAAKYYRAHASLEVSRDFVHEVESAIREILADPNRWRVVEPPMIRRRVLQDFPYVLYYRLEEDAGRIAFYAVMHCKRRPGYWRRRL
jgi:plasmid stabilization system protein ParE